MSVQTMICFGSRTQAMSTNRFPTRVTATIVRVGNRDPENCCERSVMAKKKINKTQLIKEAIAEVPDATPKDIAAALKKYGITATYVSNVKSTMKAKPKKRGRPKGSTSKSVGRPAKSSDSLDVAIKFVEQSGGLKAAKAAIEKIEKIKSL